MDASPRKHPATMPSFRKNASSTITRWRNSIAPLPQPPSNPFRQQNRLIQPSSTHTLRLRPPRLRTSVEATSPAARHHPSTLISNRFHPSYVSPPPPNTLPTARKRDATFGASSPMKRLLPCARQSFPPVRRSLPFAKPSLPPIRRSLPQGRRPPALMKRSSAPAR
jgi:hypothetical protein